MAGGSKSKGANRTDPAREADLEAGARTAHGGRARGERAASRDVRDLCEALLALESVDQCRRFLADLCTPGELRALADRWLVVRLLERGEAYRRIYEKTGVSTATVTRVARSLSHGEGGYRAVLTTQDNAPPVKVPRAKKLPLSAGPSGARGRAAATGEGITATDSAASFYPIRIPTPEDGDQK